MYIIKVALARLAKQKVVGEGLLAKANAWPEMSVDKVAHQKGPLMPYL